MAGWGARGVQRLTAEMDIAAAFAYSRGFSYSLEVIAEKFVTGLSMSPEGQKAYNAYSGPGLPAQASTRRAESRDITGVAGRGSRAGLGVTGGRGPDNFCGAGR